MITRILDMATPRQGDQPPQFAASLATAEALLGTVPVVLPTLPEVLAEYYDLTRTRHLQKSRAQRHKWHLPRDRAVRNFVDVTSPVDAAGAPILKPVSEITRADALEFRRWWSARVEAGMKVESANKDFGHLNEIFGTWAELKDVALPNPFAKLRLDGKDVRNVPAFSPAWVTGRLLDPASLAGMNAEARDVFLIMLNTGLRPSEITDAPLADFETAAGVPFLRVAPNGRELKVAHTRRDVPLLGVSLDAARRIVARGGIARYAHKAGSWSAAVNKYLTQNGLRETPAHTAYSLRHYVENALLAAKVDDRVRADILGHKYHRPSYGDGGALEGRRAALALIAL
jgi:integrase